MARWAHEPPSGSQAVGTVLAPPVLVLRKEERLPQGVVAAIFDCRMGTGTRSALGTAKALPIRPDP